MQISPLISNRSKLILLAILFVTFTPPSMACGTCAYALWEMGLPPAWLWMTSMLLWHLSFTYLNFKSGGQLTNIPSFIETIIGLFILLLISAAALGPIAFLIFLFHPGQLLFGLLFGSLSKIDEKSLKTVKRNMKAGLLFFAILLAISFTLKSQRTTADWLLKWERTSPGVVLLGKIEKGEKTISKDELRQLETQGSTGLVCKIAGKLAELKEPAFDVPLLIGVLERSDLQEEDRKRLWKALKTLTELSLPVEASPQDWRAAWKGISDSRSSPSPASKTASSSS
ncbi:MAG: hypothetical protein HQM08_25345 [Candidatus Riflebacteria bacterium]|nr:hypothetical protein [Candidatus Riflebacteria bacterium]